jgi:hypothetical protein
MEERYTEMLRAQGEAILAVKEAGYSLSVIQKQQAQISGELAAATGMTAEELIFLLGSTGSMRDATYELTAGQKELLTQFIQLSTESSSLSAEIEKANASIAEQESSIEEWKEAMGVAAEATDATAESVGSLSDEYSNAEQAARQSIESQIGYFDKLSTESNMTASEIVANWQAQRDAINNYNDNLRKAVDMGLAPELVQQLADGSKESIMYLDELVNSSEISVDEINAAFYGRLEADEAVEETMEAVSKEMSTQLAAMASDVESNLGDIKGMFFSELVEIQGMIDGLTGKTIYIDIVERASSSGGGKPNLPSLPAEASAASYNVPYLASGAVIPPNAPFMAVLGDQRHGTNVEAPLATIQEAVRAEVGGMMDGFGAIVEEVRALRATVENIEVGDTVIGEAASRYTSRQKIIHGGGTV